MKNKMWFNVIMTIVGILFILSFAVTVVLYFRPLYYHDIKSLDIESYSGYDEKEIRENYDVLIDYNTIFGPDKLEFPTLPMSETAEIHFEEVKNIFIPMQVISIAGVILLLIWIAFFKKKSYNLYYYLWMRYTAIFSGVAALTVCISMAIDWEWSFTTMHNILFDNVIIIHFIF